MGRLPLTVPWDDTVAACGTGRSVLMTRPNSTTRRWPGTPTPPAEPRDGGCVCAADGSPFGAGHYDDARRPAGRRRAGQPRVRQPHRRRRAPRRATPCSTSAPAAASTCCCRPAGSDRPGSSTGSTPPPRWSSWPAATPPKPASATSSSSTARIDARPARRRLRRRRHLQLRHRARHRQGRRVRRDRPRPSTRWPRRDQRHHPPRRRRRHRAAVDCARSRHHRRRLRRALRRAGLTDVSIQPTDPLGGGLQQRHHPRHQSQPSRCGRWNLKTGRPSGRRSDNDGRQSYAPPPSPAVPADERTTTTFGREAARREGDDGEGDEGGRDACRGRMVELGMSRCLSGDVAMGDAEGAGGDERGGVGDRASGGGPELETGVRAAAAFGDAWRGRRRAASAEWRGWR